jgi:HSP20 family molecular chaperone IbpA
MWMWAEAWDVLERAERLHRQFFRLALSGARPPVWEPPVDVFETERDLSILVALPGVEPGCIEIGVSGGAVMVAGERPVPPAFRAAAVHRLEIPYGRFERRIELPPGRYEMGSRELVNGCLLLTLRKI